MSDSDASAETPKGTMQIRLIPPPKKTVPFSIIGE
jgi:hypothetical protein